VLFNLISLLTVSVKPSIAFSRLHIQKRYENNSIVVASTPHIAAHHPG